MKDYLRGKNPPTEMIISIVGESNSNPWAEVGNWRLLTIIRALLIDPGLPPQHWAAAGTLAETIIWSTPVRYTRVTDGQPQAFTSTPYEQCTGQKPSINKIKLFGCVAHALLSPEETKKHKLSSRTITAIWMGYRRHRTGGVRLWKPGLPRYITAFTVQVDETRTYRDLLAPMPDRPLIPAAPTVIDPPQPSIDQPSTVTSAANSLLPSLMTSEPTSPQPPQLRIPNGTRIEVYCDETDFYPATVIDAKTDTDGSLIHCIIYDNYKRKYWHNLDQEQWRSLPHTLPSPTLPPQPMTPRSPLSGTLGHAELQPLPPSPAPVITAPPTPTVPEGDPTPSDSAVVPEEPTSLSAPSSSAARAATPIPPRRSTRLAESRAPPPLISPPPQTPLPRRSPRFAPTPAVATDAEPLASDDEASLPPCSPSEALDPSVEANDTIYSVSAFDALNTDTVSDDSMLSTDDTSPPSLPKVQVPHLRTVLLADGSFELYRVPRNHSEVLKHKDREQFLAAEKREVDRHESIPTAILVEPPQGAYILESIWVYDLKQDAMHRIKQDRGFKARLCAGGHEARYGLEFDLSHSSTASTEAYRTLMATAAYNGWPIYESDYTTAYLNAKLQREVFIKQPPGHERRGPNGEYLVWQLQRALYGLPQAGRLWQKTHHDELIRLGFEQCVGEYALYRKVSPDESRVVYLLINVDNVYSCGNDDNFRLQQLSSLQDQFEMKDLGLLGQSLGICVLQVPKLHQISINQTQYIRILVERFFPDGIPDKSQKRTLPADQTFGNIAILAPDDPEAIKWRRPCLQLAGCLNWVCRCTRPDIAFPLRLCMHAVQGASDALYRNLLKILAFLSNTADWAIHYGPAAHVALLDHLAEHAPSFRPKMVLPMDPITFADTNGNPDPGVSVLIFLHGGYICGRVKKLNLTTLSQYESEYFGATAAASMLMALEHSLTFYRPPFEKPFLIFCDNKAVCELAQSNQSSRRLLHVARRLEYLKERNNEGDIIITFIRTEGNLADIGTKILGAVRFHALCTTLFTRRALAGL